MMDLHFSCARKIFWHINSNTDVAGLDEPLKKVSKISDNLEIILRLIQNDKTINETWYVLHV